MKILLRDHDWIVINEEITWNQGIPFHQEKQIILRERYTNNEVGGFCLLSDHKNIAFFI